MSGWGIFINAGGQLLFVASSIVAYKKGIKHNSAVASVQTIIICCWQVLRVAGWQMLPIPASVQQVVVKDGSQIIPRAADNNTHKQHVR